MRQDHRKTMYACFIGYIVQAIVNNFAPLLFVKFQSSYGITLEKITLLITVNFMIQLCIDLASAYFIDRIGYRASAVLAHIFAAAGLVLLTVLPDALPDAYAGILISVAVYAVGGGLLEVIISPIIEACPTDNKEKARACCTPFTAGGMSVWCLSPPCSLRCSEPIAGSCLRLRGLRCRYLTSLSLPWLRYTPSPAAETTEWAFRGSSAAGYSGSSCS